MKFLPVIYFSIAFGMCNISWSMDTLDKDIAACEMTIRRISKEREELLTCSSYISMDSLIQQDKYYVDALKGEEILYNKLKQKRFDLQKELAKL